MNQICRTAPRYAVIKPTSGRFVWLADEWKIIRSNGRRRRWSKYLVTYVPGANWEEFIAWLRGLNLAKSYEVLPVTDIQLDHWREIGLEGYEPTDWQKENLVTII